MEAYILIQTELGRAPEVVAKARSVEGITSADAVVGSYDVIARMKLRNPDEAARAVATILAIDGVGRALTCPVEGQWHPEGRRHSAGGHTAGATRGARRPAPCRISPFGREPVHAEP